MNRPSWSPLVKWVLLGAAASAIVMAMDAGDEPAPARKGHMKAGQVATATLPAGAAKRAPVAERVELERLSGRKPDGGKEIGNAFDAISWYVPPPPPPPPLPLPPAKPEAPPLPFTYLGHFKSPDSPVQVIILGRADRVYTVSEGEVIDGTYRVGPVTAGLIEFTYLPLDAKQSLITDAAS